MTRQMNEAGFALLRQREQGPNGGPALVPYLCPAGKWTNGYGNTEGVTEATPPITPEQADQDLVRNAAKRAAAIDSLVKPPLNDNQFAALVCWGFNVGVQNVVESTLLRELNAGNYGQVPLELKRWNKVTDPVTKQKIVSLGLTRRRAAEIALWEMP